MSDIRGTDGTVAGQPSSRIRRRWVLKIITILALLIGIEFAVKGPEAVAAPWWWAHFSVGDGATFNSSSSIERWLAQYIRSAQNADTVYIASFTWGSGTNEPVNGSSWGINKLYLDRASIPGAAPARVIADGDDLADINSTKNTGVPMRASPASSSSTHNKIITLGTRSVMTGSMNFTSGGMSNQPNNMVIFNVSSVAKAYLAEMDDEFNNGNFDLDNTASPQNLFTSPNGDRIEAYFTPDDNGRISISPYGSGSALKDVLLYHIANSNESVFYMINRLGMSTELSGALISTSSSSKLVEGWFDVDSNGNKSSMQSDHTSRFWDDLTTSVEGHHKVMIFDMDIVATGSPNHTYQAMRDATGSPNVENMVVVYDFRMARKFMREYRRSMALIPAENVGQADSFDQTAPGAVTNLTATDVSGASNSLQVSWKGPSDADISRYYVFISPTTISSKQDIGDGVDNDNDGHYDEDPVGDADGFASGVSSLAANDDDADGSADEDPWMFPEAQAKNTTPSASVTTTLSTVNVGDQLQDNTNYWIAVVAVDKHGNEGPVSIVGPVQSAPAGPGAQPAATVAFTSGFSELVSAASSVSVAVSNGSTAQSAIRSVTVDFGSGVNGFVVSGAQSPPLGWTVTSSTSQQIVFTANSAADDIAAGSSRIFPVTVTNPSASGTSNNVSVTVTAANALVTGPLSAGALTVQATAAPTVTKAVDGTNTITNLSGGEKLQDKDVTLSFQFGSPPLNATTVEFWWDAEGAPDGPGGSGTDQQATVSNAADADAKTFQAVIPSTAAEVVHGANVRFIIRGDSVTYTNGGTPWAFLIDSFAEPVSGLTLSSFGSDNAALKWTALSGIGDFSSYRIYYSTASPVTTAASSWTAVNDPNLSTISTTQTTVTGLSQLTTYYFAVAHVDALGNVSSLSAEVSTTTSKTVGATVTSVTDGTNSITNLDGSQKLLDQTSTIRFTLSDAPVNPSTVSVYFDVGAEPDGPAAANGQDRKVAAVGSGTSWEAIVPGADEEVVPGATVRFGIFVDGTLLLTGGTSWKYQIVSPSSELLRNLRVTDTAGGSVSLSWDASQIMDFKEYRVFYSSTDTTITTTSARWGPAQDFRLASSANNQTTISGLAPNTLYRFNVASVNSLGSSGGVDAAQQQAATTNSRRTVVISEISPVDSTDNFVELYAEVGPVRTAQWRLLDMDGNAKTLPDVTLAAGKYMVLHSTAGVDETDTTGAGADGVWDAYALPAAILPAAGDQPVLLDANGDTLDAAAYWDGVTVLSADDLADLAALNTQGAWLGGDTASCLRHIGQGNFTFPRREDIATSLKYKDNQLSSDFELTPSRTPGANNAYIAAIVSSMTDGIRTIFAMDGSEILRPDTVTVTVTLSPAFSADTRVLIVYTTDGTSPTASSSSRSTTANAAKTVFTATIPPAAAVAAVSVKILVGGTIFDASGRAWKYKVDAGPPPGVDGLSAVSRTSSTILLSWNPIGATSDFLEYRIYYDTAAGITSAARLLSPPTSATLANISTGSLILGALTPGETYYFRITAADQSGSTAPLSAEVSAAAPNPILPTVSQIVDSAGNAAISYSGLTTISTETPVIHFSFANFPQNASTVEVWWDTVATADGPGGSGTDTRVAAVSVWPDTRSYTATINKSFLGLADGATLNWIIRADSVNLFLTGTTPWKVKLDGTAGAAPGGISILPDPSVKNSTSLNFRWLPVSTSDFSEYIVYYAAGANVTKSDTKWTRVKDAALSNISTNYTIVNGLAASVAYTFAVVFRDARGNESTLSDTARQTTNATSPADDPAYDGVNVAHLLDGSETLQDTDIMIEMLLGYAPADPATVKLWYDVGAVPDGPGASNPDDRWVPMWDNDDGDRTSFVARVPENDKEMVDGALVKYVVEVDGFVKNNGGRPYMYKLDGSIPDQVVGISFGRDLGTAVSLRWTPISAPPDFSTYRVRWSRKPPAKRAGYFSKDQFPDLGNPITGQIILTVPADTNLFFNVTAADAAGHESPMGDDAVLLRVAAPVGSEMLDKIEATASAPEEAMNLWHPTAGEARIQMDPWGRKMAVFGPIPGPGHYYLVVLSKTTRDIAWREFDVTTGQYILWDMRNQAGMVVPPGDYEFELSSNVKVYTGQTYGYGGWLTIR